MIRHPALLLAAFIALTVALRKSSDHPALNRLFRILPVPFWCYFLPMLGAASGLFPSANPLYGFLSQHLLPVCLALLLLGADLPAIARMGPLALWMMLAGSAGTVVGGLASFFLYRSWLPEGSWAAVGALAGSWTGGSANLLAVKEALQAPDALIGPIILVDAAVAYTWMALLIGSSGLQGAWDTAVRRAWGFATPPVSGFRPLRGVGFAVRAAAQRAAALYRRPRSRPAPSAQANRAHSASEACCTHTPSRPDSPKPDSSLTPGSSAGLAAIILLAVLISLAAQAAAQRLPAFGAAMSTSAWAVLLVTTAALLLSLTPLRKLAESGGSGAGSFLLFVLLCSIGARGNLAAVGQAPVFLLLGATWILIHGLVLLAVGYLCRAPLGLIATASQANIGGPISAPMVGATFSKPLAGVGLLMAIFGNILGTYIGLATALIARAIASAGGFR